MIVGEARGSCLFDGQRIDTEYHTRDRMILQEVEALWPSSGVLERYGGSERVAWR